MTRSPAPTPTPSSSSSPSSSPFASFADGLDPVPPELAASCRRLREQVRAFLADELAAGRFVPRCDAWLSGWDPDFSRRLAERGWVGMTIPAEYGGGGRGLPERHVVTVELLAAGAPVAAHWIADRQTAPSLLRFGGEAVKRRFLPAISRGECFFAIGMSEPDSGSDLASVRTRAVPTDGGWLVEGRKVWTSGAHRAHAFFVLCRTGERGADRHAGLSQLIVPLDAPGVEIRPIRLLTGEEHFNEVILDRVFVPHEMVLGEIGAGWHQVTSELAVERSGPERFMSTYPLLVALVERLRATGRHDNGELGELGELFAELLVLRRLSWSIACRMERGGSPEVDAALVKDLGTAFERKVVEAARRLAPAEPDITAADPYERLLAEAVLHTPGFTLRGGTTEILRQIVARALLR
ncbi:MAG TPA: acyl-CoA dehydrogenase family protein [Streptosporangiaceae bacterium]|nr:acyl-CoA dehydrogenase family protein [Streptosporangiaceae bacterium]